MTKAEILAAAIDEDISIGQSSCRVLRDEVIRLRAENAALRGQRPPVVVSDPDAGSVWTTCQCLKAPRCMCPVHGTYTE
jgi:hypothetical protein